MLSDSGSLSAAGSAPEGEAFVNLMRERTFNPELRNLIDKVTGVNSNPAASAETLKKFHKIFYRAKNIPWRPSREPRDVDFPACGDSLAEIARKAAAFAKAAAENGFDRLVWAGIDKAAVKETEVLRARYQLSLVYERLKRELKGRAFFLRLRADSFSVFTGHESLGKLRNSLGKPDFNSGFFYKQEVFFEDRFPDDSDILGIVLRF